MNFHSSSVIFFAGALTWVLLATPAHSAEPNEAAAPGPYTIKPVSVPESVAGQIAAVDYSPAGDCVLLSRSGHVFLKKTGQDTWQQWSEQGLEGATGLFAGYFPQSIYVVHATGISRLFDTDGDEQVDFVKAVIPAWRFETLGELFRGSPAVLPEGDLLLSPNVSAGEWSGLVMRVPEAEPVTPWLTGFRKITTPTPGPEGGWIVAGFPAGSEKGETEGTEKLNERPAAIWVIEGPDPPSEDPNKAVGVDEDLATDGSAEGDEDEEDGEEVKAELVVRQPVSVPIAAIHLPHSLMPSAPITPACPIGASADAFGPFSEQAFVAGQSSKHLLRLMLEQADGQWQGAVTDFAALESTLPGLEFLRFTPDGDELLAGQAGHLLSISPTGTPIYAIQSLRLASDGFEVSFTRPIDRAKAIDPKSWRILKWSPEDSETEASALPPDSKVSIVIDSDALAATCRIEGLESGFAYVFDLSSITSEIGEALSHGPVYYTLNAFSQAAEDKISANNGVNSLDSDGPEKSERLAPPVDQPIKATKLEEALDAER